MDGWLFDWMDGRNCWVLSCLVQVWIWVGVGRIWACLVWYTGCLVDLIDLVCFVLLVSD